MSILREMSEENVKTFKAGERIITKGEHAACAYMILSGSAHVLIEEGTRMIELATLEKNDIFGESSIFEGGQYGAHVDALEDCALMVITPESLNDRLDDSDDIVRALFLMLIKRLKQTNEALVKSETREFMDIALV